MKMKADWVMWCVVAVCSCCRTHQMKSWSWPPLHYAIYCWSSHPAKRYTLKEIINIYVICNTTRGIDFITCKLRIFYSCWSIAHPGVRGDWITMQSDPEWQSCTEGQWNLGPDGKKMSLHFFTFVGFLQPSKSWQVNWFCAFQHCSSFDIMKQIYLLFF